MTNKQNKYERSGFIIIVKQYANNPDEEETYLTSDHGFYCASASEYLSIAIVFNSAEDAQKYWDGNRYHRIYYEFVRIAPIHILYEIESGEQIL